MNIEDFWPQPEEVTEAFSKITRVSTLLNHRIPYPIMEKFFICEVIQPRAATFNGFLDIEKENGGIIKGHLSTTKGQEMLRVMLFRALEEMAESLLSAIEAHRKEELIDAFNYLAAIPLLDESLFSEAWIAEVLVEAFSVAREMKSPGPLTTEDLGKFVLVACGELGDTLRNRAWMHNPQDLYFSGTIHLKRVLVLGCSLIFSQFSDLQEFWLYFTAKDRVLQFRIKSMY